MSDQTVADNVRPIDRAKEAVTETVDKTRDVVGERLETAREKFHEVADQVGEKVHDVTASAQRASEEARRRARERYEVTSQQLREGYGRMREDVGGVVDDIVDYTRENPAKAILIAAAAGFILGLVVGPRRRHHD